MIAESKHALADWTRLQDKTDFASADICLLKWMLTEREAHLMLSFLA